MLSRVLGILSILAFISCSEKEQQKGINDYKGPLLVTSDVDLVFTDSARIKFTMKAAEQVKYKDQNEEFPKGIYIEFYDRNQQKETSLKSRYAEFNKEKNLWFVKDSVVLNNFNRHRILKSEELYWDPDKKEVWCDTSSKIVVIDGDQTLWGKGLKAKDDFSEYEIYNPIAELSL